MVDYRTPHFLQNENKSSCLIITTNLRRGRISQAGGKQNGQKKETKKQTVNSMKAIEKNVSKEDYQSAVCVSHVFSRDDLQKLTHFNSSNASDQ